MYDDDLLRTPTDEVDLWDLLESHLEHVRYVLGLHLETRDEALARTEGRGAAMAVIRYHDISEEWDSKPYFHAMGRELLSKVESQLEQEVITPALIQDWGKLMFCHGYLASHVLDDSDTLVKQRAGKKAASERSVDEQRLWISRILSPLLRQGQRRKVAEDHAARIAQAFVDAGGYESFSPEWFGQVLRGSGSRRTTAGPIIRQLKTTYESTNLTEEEIHELAKVPMILPPRDLAI